MAREVKLREMVMMVTANWQQPLCVFQHFEQARRVDHVLRAHLGASIPRPFTKFTYLENGTLLPSRFNDLLTLNCSLPILHTSWAASASSVVSQDTPGQDQSPPWWLASGMSLSPPHVISDRLFVTVLAFCTSGVQKAFERVPPTVWRAL